MKVTCDFSVTSARHQPMSSSTPWYEPWLSPLSATVPALVLDLQSNTYGAGGALDTFDDLITFTRASAATRTNTAGALEVMAADVARLEHDSTSFAPLGLTLETATTNLFVQTATPADQTILVSGASHVLSFYGSGTVTLGGTHSATVIGNGSYPARTEFAFTPTVGSLTLTLVGEVVSPQLEEGAGASSFVPTTGVAASRSEDNAAVPLGGWFDTSAGTLVFEGIVNSAMANTRIVEIDSGATSTRLSILWNDVLNLPQFQVWEAGVLQAAIAPPASAISLGESFRVAIAYGASDFAISLNGSAVASDTSGVVPTGLTNLRLGRTVWGAQGLMLAERVAYYPARLSNAELQTLSA